MARLFPTIPSRSTFNGGEHAELELLDRLEHGLSGAYSLFHSVDWSRGAGANERHGEIDIVAVNQGGDVLLIEVKSGEVEFRADGIYKAYGAKDKNVTAQIGMQYGAMRSRLNDARLNVHLHHLLVLPDMRVQTATAQWPRERIVDSAGMASIVSRIGELLGPGSRDSDVADRVLAFFSNRFRVEPDVSAMAGRMQQASTRMSAGLATWVPRIEAPSGVIRVVGTAGSGKTQLALRLLSDADTAGRKAAYLCFNRALADHMAQLAPVRTPAETFHEFALRVTRRAGHDINFSQPGAFERIATLGMAALDGNEPDLDLLVLDEVQDLQPEWVESLLSRLREGGRAVLLEDPEQQLYKDRESFDIESAVIITSHENFRTPRALVKLINALHLTSTEVDALAPSVGEMPDPIVYDAAEKIAACTVTAVERCLARGFALDDIAIVSMRGRERSVLQGLERLGTWTLRRFTGRYDEGGGAIWTDGQLLIESVRRFKGQAASAVVLTECDIAELDAMNRRLLFVGLTRARAHLEWVMSDRTAAMMEQAAV